MGNIVGIDLGTTNSVAAFKFAQDLDVATADDNQTPDRKLTRSIVAATQNGIIVGETAYNQLKSDPENVIISIKRLIGRGFSDPVVKEKLDRLNYKVARSTKGTDDSLSVWLGGKEYEPEDISAEILKKVVKNAQDYQIKIGKNGTITHAVITVPAYFSDKQRYATQTAAKRAGLAEPELLPEPTAAAISYGFKPDSDDVKTILVYDFGGGTFDSALITAAGNQFIESGKAGDLWLGGDDIDDLIIQIVKKQVAAEENLDDIDGLIAKMPRYQKVRFLGDLKMAVEKAKIDLSTSTEAKIIPSTPLLDELGMAISINVTITCAQFEAMILPLVERTISICQEAIKYSDYPADMIDIVLLVGGSSQIPLVQQKVREAFGAEKVVIHPRPMYAVAEGAAIVAAGLTEKVGTVSRDYFIELVDQPRYKIIRQGDILPIKTTHTFKIEADGQSLIHFKFSNPDDVNNRDEKIGEMWLSLDQAYPEGTEVLVTAELDEKNSSLQITAILKNNPSVKVSSSFSRGGEDEKIAQKVEEIICDLNQKGTLTEWGVQEAYRIAGEAIQATNQLRGQNVSVVEDRRQVAEQKLKELERLASSDYNLAESLVRDLEFAVNTCAAIIPDSQQVRITSICDQLNKAIADSNLSTIQKLIEDANREFENLPELVKIVLLCASAIGQAHRINPTQASLMSNKFNQMLSAIERGNTHQAEQLLQELLPDVQQYLDRELPTRSIATGIRK
jgi:molecular chaperone DnaK